MVLQEKTLGYEPKRVLGFFEQICKIPHGSFNEEKIADYLQTFANQRGLYCYRDAKNNVLIKLPATEKYKDAPAFLIQGHTDMVCEKTSDSKHDLSMIRLISSLKTDFSAPATQRLEAMTVWRWL